MEDRDGSRNRDTLRNDPHAVEIGFAEWPHPRDEPNNNVISSRLLFGEARRMVLIDHDGERYRLQITRAGKLLLTK